jgi:hypothetical protein
MEQVTRYNNVTPEVNIQVRINTLARGIGGHGHTIQQCHTGGQYSGQSQQTGLNCTGQTCMKNRMVMEQVRRYNNITQEVNIQVRINIQVRLYDEVDGHGTGHTIQQCHTGGQHSGQSPQTGLNCTGQTCMKNWMVMEQVKRYNNITQEVNIQVRINIQVRFYDEVDGHGAGYKIKQYHTGGQHWYGGPPPLVRRCNGTAAEPGYWKVGLEWPDNTPPGQ